MTLDNSMYEKNIISLHALRKHTTITPVISQTRHSLKNPLNETASTFFLCLISRRNHQSYLQELFANKYIFLEPMKEKVFEKANIEK